MRVFAAISVVLCASSSWATEAENFVELFFRNWEESFLWSEENKQDQCRVLVDKAPTERKACLNVCEQYWDPAEGNFSLTFHNEKGPDLVRKDGRGVFDGLRIVVLDANDGNIIREEDVEVDTETLSAFGTRSLVPSRKGHAPSNSKVRAKRRWSARDLVGSGLRPGRVYEIQLRIPQEFANSFNHRISVKKCSGSMLVERFVVLAPTTDKERALRLTRLARLEMLHGRMTEVRRLLDEARQLHDGLDTYYDLMAGLCRINRDAQGLRRTLEEWGKKTKESDVDKYRIRRAIEHYSTIVDQWEKGRRGIRPRPPQ